jgi:hypothetical protein
MALICALSRAISAACSSAILALIACAPPPPRLNPADHTTLISSQFRVHSVWIQRGFRIQSHAELISSA